MAITNIIATHLFEKIISMIEKGEDGDENIKIRKNAEVILEINTVGLACEYNVSEITIIRALRIVEEMLHKKYGLPIIAKSLKKTYYILIPAPRESLIK